ncbi:MAG: ABC transporter permease [Bernardetiaceae bacterium]|jgi:hypothetical protein|nr:ABC transporter permease [Bernardetiaceae bacterium]
MVKLFLIEWYKLRRTPFFWGYLALVFLLSGAGCYLFFNGIKLKSALPGQVIVDTSPWPSLYSSFFSIQHLVLTAIFGSLLLFWQHRENQDNTFKQLYLWPISTYESLLIRFITFFSVYVVIALASMTFSFYLGKWGLLQNYPQYQSTLVFGEAAEALFRRGALAYVALSAGFYLFLYLITLLNSKLTVSLLCLIGLLLLSFFNLPGLLFFRSALAGSKLVLMISARSRLFTSADLTLVYQAQVVSVVLFFGVLFLLTKNKLLLKLR